MSTNATDNKTLSHLDIKITNIRQKKNQIYVKFTYLNKMKRKNDLKMSF